jgi:hypothetical protein
MFYARLMPDVTSPVPDLSAVPLDGLPPLTPELLARLLAASGRPVPVPGPSFNSGI